MVRLVTFTLNIELQHTALDILVIMCGYLKEVFVTAPLTG